LPAVLATDDRRDLGDPHAAANVTQAHPLWRASGLPEQTFVTLLQDARARLRRPQASGMNKGAYWFACLRDLVRPQIEASA
jgi:hypothetical protein